MNQWAEISEYGKVVFMKNLYQWLTCEQLRQFLDEHLGLQEGSTMWGIRTQLFLVNVVTVSITLIYSFDMWLTLSLYQHFNFRIHQNHILVMTPLISTNPLLGIVSTWVDYSRRYWELRPGQDCIYTCGLVTCYDKETAERVKAGCYTVSFLQDHWQ